MSSCAGCGREIPSAAGFCAGCGAALPRMSEPPQFPPAPALATRARRTIRARRTTPPATETLPPVVTADAARPANRARRR